MRRFRSTKIVATLGPTSSTPETIESLFLNGVDVFRLNFSHGDHESHRKNYESIRVLEQKYKRPISIIQDLQGPKLRIGTFEFGKVHLVQGQQFILDMKTDIPGNQERISIPHPEIFEAFREGSIIQLNDGKIRLRVSEVYRDFCETFVLEGGELADAKGLTVPGLALPISPITEKDKEDLAFGLSLGVDFIAMSFVQKPDDVDMLRELVGIKAGIISKIEKPLAVQHIRDIIHRSDAIMIARGDLGLEMPPEDVPSIQKQIVRQCRSVGKPVIIATQMLETMIESTTPTRAEASDVATAVYEGVDAVMLSAETAIGKHPVETVTMMNRIIERVETDSYYRISLDTSHPVPEATASDSITVAARKISDTLNLKAMVTLTKTGTTALRAARERPNVPIIGVTPDYLTAHVLSLTWGTHPILLPELLAVSPLPTITNVIYTAVLAENYANIGDEILITVGAQFEGQDKHKVFHAGSTRGLFILQVKDPREDDLEQDKVAEIQSLYIDSGNSVS